MSIRLVALLAVIGTSAVAVGGLVAGAILGGEASYRDGYRGAWVHVKRQLQE